MASVETMKDRSAAFTKIATVAIGAESQVNRLATKQVRSLKLEATQKQITKRSRARNNVQNAPSEPTDRVSDVREKGNANTRKNRRRAHAKELVETFPIEPYKLGFHNVRRYVVDGGSMPEPSTSCLDEHRVTQTRNSEKESLDYGNTVLEAMCRIPRNEAQVRGRFSIKVETH